MNDIDKRLSNKYQMWKQELERQNAGLGVHQLLDSIMVDIGEVHRELKDEREKVKVLEEMLGGNVTYE